MSCNILAMSRVIASFFPDVMFVLINNNNNNKFIQRFNQSRDVVSQMFCGTGFHNFSAATLKPRPP